MNITHPTALFVLLSMGCAETPFQGTSTGNAIKMGLQPDESGRYVTSSKNGTEFTVDGASASVSRISFPLPSLVGCERLGLSAPLSCDASGDGAEIVGDYSVDLLSGEFSPDLEDLTLPAIKFETIDADVQTIDVSGTFDYDDTSVAYSLSASLPSTLLFTADGVPKLEDNQAISMLLNPESWMGAIAVTQCITDGDLEITEGTLEITNDCDNALERIGAAVQDSTVLQID